jgi:hypothetical protein
MNSALMSTHHHREFGFAVQQARFQFLTAMGYAASVFSGHKYAEHIHRGPPKYWYLTQHTTPIVFEKKMLRKVIGSERGEVTGGCLKFQCEKLDNLYM